MKLTFNADTETTWITAESGHDVARIERITLDGWPDLEPGNYLTDEGWQDLIDSLHAPHVACHGLPIPPDVPPGALAALVDAARAVDRADIYIHERPLALASLRAALAPFTADPAPPVSPPEAWGIRNRGTGTLKAVFNTRPEAGAALAGIETQRDHYAVAMVSPHETDPLPEGVHDGRRKPYGYAVKANTKGYLAIQGNQAWFESEPVGWAIFGTEDHARVMLEGNHSMIGTAPHEGGEVVPVYRD